MKDSTKENLAVGALVVFLFAILAGASAGYNEWLYGDWRCAFAECRLEK